ncbi:MAG: hypothetical protein IKM73_07915 [Acidaminococcaceae bacterium]|nr:hypothetical protein [Acidaminococcaceae bacterium]
MKKLLVSLMAVMLLLAFSASFAEDLTNHSLDDLTARRQELIDELTQVNALRGAMLRQQVEDGVMPEEALGKIIDLFPDEELAKIIRDKCGKFSIEQPVTQADLDNIEQLLGLYNDIHDFTGIRYLRNLTYFHANEHYDGAFPEELRFCRLLSTLSLYSNPNITAIPDWIGELVNLQWVDFHSDNIVQLPDSFCDLTNLEYLDLGRNINLVALPDSIGNLKNLQNLYISQTAITELPESIWNLTLSYIDMSGLPIR